MGALAPRVIWGYLKIALSHTHRARQSRECISSKIKDILVKHANKDPRKKTPRRPTKIPELLHSTDKVYLLL